jgi:hypothetical protein
VDNTSGGGGEIIRDLNENPSFGRRPVEKTFLDLRDE